MKMVHKGVKLTKVQDAAYDNGEVYEREGYTIERDASCLSGGIKMEQHELSVDLIK